MRIGLRGVLVIVGGLMVGAPAWAFDTMEFLNNMKDFGETLIPVISVIAFVSGLFLLGNTMVHVVNAHRGQGPLSHADGGVKVGPVLMRVVITACLISFGMYMSKTIETLFASEVPYRSALAYAPVAQMSNNRYWQLAWAVCVVWVVLIGVVGMFRGLLLWNDAASENQGGGDLFWRGLWHIVGGAAAVNIGIFFT